MYNDHVLYCVQSKKFYRELYKNFCGTVPRVKSFTVYRVNSLTVHRARKSLTVQKYTVHGERAGVTTLFLFLYYSVSLLTYL